MRVADLGASIRLMPYMMYEKLGLGEPKSTRMSLELADRLIQYPRGIIENVLIKVDKFVLPIDFVILDMSEDSRVPIILGRPFLATARAMIDVFNKKYNAKGEPIQRIESVNTPYLVAQKIVEPNKVKRSNIKGISLSYYTHKILMEDDYKPVIQPQRHLNLKVQDVVKNNIVKLLDSGLIYPILDSSWVSPIHVVPKKGGMTVVLNDDNELIPSRTVTGWILPNPDRTRRSRKTTFTCPYGTFAYRRMSFGLCNALATFQRCMTVIFHDMVEDFMEVFMDDFLIFGVDYVSKWIEAQELPTNDVRVVIKFLRRLFVRFGVPKALISDRRTYLCNSQLEKALQKYGVTHKLSTAYHPQTNGQIKVTNRAIKRILKRFKMHPGKLKPRWYGPNVVMTVYPYGTVEIIDRNETIFKVNIQRLKKYHDGLIEAEDKEVVEFEEDTT
nr:hypothetical protein [Tanacetum cinerariifolium]